MSGIKVYNWQSELGAKSEYFDWYNQLVRALGLRQVGFTLTLQEMDTFRPTPIPMPAPDPLAPQERQDLYAKYKYDHDKELKKFYGQCVTAMSVLRESLKYDCKASHEMELAYRTIPTDAYGQQLHTPEEWTPDVQFLAALKKLQAYAPQDGADVHHIRQKMANLTDEAGFDTYSQEFMKCLGALINAHKPPTPDELSNMVRNSIRNERVKTYLASTVITIHNPSPTYEHIFACIESFLKNLGQDGTIDPYRKVNASPTKQLTAMKTDKQDPTNGTRPMLCTRCWRNNHNYCDCRATICRDCGTRLGNNKICPNQDNHKNKSHIFRGRLRSVQKRGNDEVTDDAINKAKARLEALIAKKQKLSDPESTKD